MLVSECPETRAYLLALMRAKLDAMPRILEPGVAHTSELSLCPMKPHYARTLKEQPPLSDESVLQFMRGRGLEYFIGGELPVLTKDGISGTIDTAWVRILELKSTQTDMGQFKPEKPYDHWLISCKAYCTLSDTNAIDLGVWFLGGDLKTTRKVKTELKTWTLTFTEDELAENWAYCLAERAKMFECIDKDIFPSEEWVKSRRKGFECGGCRYSEPCPLWQAKGM
jgi:hypothetical protein